MLGRPIEPKPWWRRLAFRLSIRAMILLVMAIGGGLGWIVHRARTQRLAVAAIERAGGKVEYDWEWTDHTTCPPTPPLKPWPKWLVDTVGVDYLADVSSVVFMGSLESPDNPDRASDDLMREVGRLGRLKVLCLYDSNQVTDAGLAHIGQLSLLRSLVVNSHNVSDAGLGSLRELDPRILNLSDCPVTAEGLVHLKGMGHLKELSLSFTQVNTIEPLRSLTGLKILDLRRCPISDAGIAPIAGLTNLTTLNLGETPIGDDGAAHLRNLTGLDHLFLDATRITDASLPDLVALPNLVVLALTQTAIGDDGLAKFRPLKGPRSLNLDETRVTDNGLAHLARLKGCAHVTASGTKVTTTGAVSLMKAVPGMFVSH
jgi:hypothetical protein